MGLLFYRSKIGCFKNYIVFAMLILMKVTAVSQPNLQQERRILSLPNTSDSLKMDAAFKISKDICFTAPDSGVYYGKLALNFARKANLLIGEASALNQIGYAFNIQSRVDSSLYYMYKSVDVYTKCKDEFHRSLVLNNIASQLIFTGEYDKAKAMLTEAEATLRGMDSTEYNKNTYANLGMLYDIQGDYVEGQKYYLKGFNIAKQYRDTLGMAESLNNIAVMYYYLDNYEKMLQYSRDALSYSRGQKAISIRAKLFLNMAVSFEQLGKLDSAIYYNLQSLELNESLKNELEKSKIYHNLGCLYLDSGKIDKGLLHLLKAKEIKEKFPLREGIAPTYIYLGRAYTLKADFPKAKSFLQKGLDISKQLNIPEDIKDAYKYWAEYCEITGDYKRAHRYYKDYISIQDSIQNADIKTRVADLEIKYETAKKEAENQELKAKQVESQMTIIQHRRILYIAIVGIILLCGLLAMIYIQKEKQKQLTADIRRQKNQIEILNQELNHRVKNNLSFMSSLLEMHGRRSENSETKELLLESGNRLKTLALVHDNLIKNDQEKEISIKNYLSELIAHLEALFAHPDKKIVFQSDLSELPVNAEDAMRIGIIVNELITNSVKHAFKEVEHPVVSIRAYSDVNGKLVLDYKDNGRGIQNADKPNSASVSLGTKLIALLKEQLGDRVVIVT